MFVYPEVERLWEQDQETRSKVSRLRNFFQATKFQQRMMLKTWEVPIPWTSGDSQTATRNFQETTGRIEGRFVVRPMHHMKGHHYRLTHDPGSFQTGSEYVSEVFRKTREYRVIFIKGNPLVVLRKKVPEGTDPEAPWNHATGSFFQTVNDVPACMLSRGDFFARMRDCPLVRDAHIVGVDVLWNKYGYVVCEFNAAPALTIENNLQKVVDFLRGLP